MDSVGQLLPCKYLALPQRIRAKRPLIVGVGIDHEECLRRLGGLDEGQHTAYMLNISVSVDQQR
jgi:hypothetical protein